MPVFKNLGNPNSSAGVGSLVSRNWDVANDEFRIRALFARPIPANSSSALIGIVIALFLNREPRSSRGAIMTIRRWRFITLVLAALALTMESAHVLELPQKMQYGAQMYAAVNTTLYRYFAIVGGIYQIGSIVAAAVLAFIVRKRSLSFHWTLAGFLCFLLAFGVWLAVVAPVNTQVADALRAAPESVPEVWLCLRNRWEYGHVTGFVLQLAGFCALVLSVLVETPKPGRDMVIRTG